MELEYGRKIISHLFKRNNYKTMVVGKPQPVETNIQWNNKVISSLKIKIDFCLSDEYEIQCTLRFVTFSF